MCLLAWHRYGAKDEDVLWTETGDVIRARGQVGLDVQNVVSEQHPLQFLQAGDVGYMKVFQAKDIIEP